MENLSDYLVKNAKQILLHLDTLVAGKCLIAVNFGENHSFLSAILEIDAKNKIITIDCGPKEYLNKELLSLGIVNCKADLGGIKILFEGRGVKKAGQSGQMALSMKIPEKIYWIQRRKFYRIRSPLSKNSYCSITFQETEEENEETLEFKLFDLSATGFSIISDSKDLAIRLTLDTEFTNCKLVLEDSETQVISFIVKSKLAINPTKPTKSQRIGCEFTNTTAKAESAFLRYMQEIERELRRNLE